MEPPPETATAMRIRENRGVGGQAGRVGIQRGATDVIPSRARDLPGEALRVRPGPGRSELDVVDKDVVHSFAAKRCAGVVKPRAVWGRSVL